MAVKPGYKLTEVGVIPEDWRVGTIGQISDVGRGRVISHREIEKSITQTYPVYSSQTSNEGVMGYLDTFDFDGEYITWTTDGANAGTVFYRNGRFNCTNVCGTIRAISDDTFFLSRALAVVAQKHVSHNLGNPKLMNDIVKRIAIAMPSTLPEQQAIATALSDVDTLITKLDQLIAKKRDIKQATMQQLLTGQTRLPGFSGEWEVKRLGTTATLKARIGWQGLTTAEYLNTGDYYLVTGTDFKGGYIDWSNCHYVDEFRYKQDRYIQLTKYDVLVTKDGTIGKVALVNDLYIPATLNSGVFVIRPIDGAFHPEFFYYLLCSQLFTEFLTQLSAGSTINHLYQKDFVDFSYKTPPTLSEQAAIATILSDMDAEITALESRRKKTRALKQGMMQELLTGRIRLIPPAAHAVSA
ncbi:MAG: restriction endonuclease subunit S [Acidithiobacillus sp.]